MLISCWMCKSNFLDHFTSLFKTVKTLDQYIISTLLLLSTQGQVNFKYLLIPNIQNHFIIFFFSCGPGLILVWMWLLAMQ